MQFGYTSTDLTRISGDQIPSISELLSFLASEGDPGNNHMSFGLAGPDRIVRWQLTQVNSVPEPTSLTMLVLGSSTVLVRRRS